MKVKVVDTYSTKQSLESMDIARRRPGPHDVRIKIAYCGACHSNIRQVRSERARTAYPCVLGHEVMRHMATVGDRIRKHTPDGLVGVSCIVDSCKYCEECENGLGSCCDHTARTCSSSIPDEPDHILDGHPQQVVIHERYVLCIRRP